MATHLKTQADDFDLDKDFTCLTGYTVPYSTAAGLREQVQDMELEVERLRECLNDSLELQRGLLKQWDEMHCISPGTQQPIPAPMATSTPFAPAVP